MGSSSVMLQDFIFKVYLNIFFDVHFETSILRAPFFRSPFGGHQNYMVKGLQSFTRLLLSQLLSSVCLKSQIFRTQE